MSMTYLRPQPPASFDGAAVARNTAFGRADAIPVELFGADPAAADSSAGLLAALEWAMSNSGKVRLQAGAAYTIAQEIATAKSNLGWFDLDLNQGSIEQQTDNLAVFRFTGDNVHHGRIHGGSLQWANPQPATNTAAVAIAWQNGDGTGSSTSGYYSWELYDLIVHNGYRGLAITQTSGQEPVWNLNVHDAWFTTLSGAWAYLSSPTNIGMPNNQFRNIYVSNAEANTTEAHCYLTQQEQLTIDNVEYNKAVRRLFDLRQCFGHIGTIKLENGQGGGPSHFTDNAVFNFQQTAMTFDQLTISTTDWNQGAKAYIFRNYASGQGSIHVGSIKFTGVTITSGNLYAITTDACAFTLGGAPLQISGSAVPLTDVDADPSAGFVRVLRPSGTGYVDPGDADYTLTWGSQPPTVQYAGALTANRALTLNPNGKTSGVVGVLPIYEGARVRVAVFDATYHVTINGSIQVGPAKWVELVWSRAHGWQKIATGAIA